MPWNGSIHLDPPEGLSHEAELKWRLDYDLVWVMQNLITILDKDRNEKVPFVLNRPQAWAMWNIVEMYATGRPSWGWFLKGRQFGFSTLFVTILFICALRGENGLLLAHLEKPGRSIFRKPEMALKNLPTLEMTEEDAAGERVTQVVSLVPPPSSFSKESLMAWAGKAHNAVLRRDSAEIRDAGVGETYQHAQFTEIALFPDAPHTIGHLLPALSRVWGTFVNGEGTARGEGDYFHRMWLSGLDPDGIFRSVFAAWYWMESYGRREWRPEDAPLSPRELAIRESVRRVGSEFPLTDEGRLIPRLQEIYDRNGRVAVHDLEVGFELTDGHLLFLRDMLKSFAGDTVLLASEFPNSWREAFRTAGRKLIPSEVMDVIEAGARDPLPGKAGRGEYVSTIGARGRGKARWQPRLDGRVHRFELPKPDATYLLWMDPSSGTGVDPTGMGVYRVTYQKAILALSFEGFVRPHDAARIALRISRHYRDGAQLDPGFDDGTLLKKSGRPCVLVTERNGFGEGVITEWQRLKARRIWRYSDRSKDNSTHGHDYGFPTYKDTKNPMLHKFGQAAYDEQLVIPCRRVHTSMRAMQYLDDEDKTIGAPRGQHDDLAMGGGIGFWAASELGVFRLPPRVEDPAWLAERTLFPNAG